MLNAAYLGVSINMTVDLHHLESTLRWQHKATTRLAEKASGVIEGDLLFHPIIVTKGHEVFAYFASKHKGDSDYFAPYVVNAALSMELILKGTSTNRF